ncbi:MAG: ABC transporter permease, partial [Clostridia bacterium]|nr:ABC transporter permease [Clostridia bacterium]
NNISGIFYNKKYAIGGVFFVIAILICYSVITRLVNDEAILIGTKKALGFRKKELISTYLAFSLISSGIGIVLGIAVAMVLEKIMVPVVLISNYSVDINTSYFGIELVLIITAITFILITAITYLGSSSIIKKNALKLLQGNVDNENKKQFSNKKSVSKAKLSLFYKTIIRNFKQDGKRIFATVIGISSSIALITASFSLKITMQKSFDIHFNEYIKYDSIVFIDSNVENAYDNLVEHFEEQNIKYTPVYKEFVTYHIDDSDAIIGDMFVYYNDDSFNELVTVQPSKKNSSFNNKGFWFPESYQKDFKCKDDALISLVDSKGNVTDFNSTGFYKYYNYYSATFVDYDTYSKTFDNQVEPNAFLINRNGEEINAFIEQMKTVKGHLYTFDSYGKTVKDMSVFNLVTTILFALYALATLLLAIFVILNLFVTHVKEKKRELIVLMINGYSKKDVAKYIYLDIILLTLISIVVGSLLGALLSWFGQVSIESTTMYLLHETDILSIALGNVIGIALVFIMTLISLKEIGKFKLKDINNN